MSFGAMAAWQALLLLAVSGAAAAYIFRLRIRPPRVSVASLLLWRKVFDHQREQTWWERVRRAISLAATVLIALALAVAVARPGPAVSATSRGRLLIVLDSSWSMLTESPRGGTRWAQAIAAARRLAASSGGEAVAIATTAQGLVEGPTTDGALIETAIDQLAPAGGEDAAWPRVGGADAVHFFTDGTTPRSLEPGVVVHSVYDPAPNVAVTALGVRPAATARTGGEAYLEVVNYSPDAQPVTLTVTRGTAVVFDQSIEMAAGEAIRQVIPLGDAGDPRIRARVSARANALAIDDEAVAWLTQAEPLNVLVVSADPGALMPLLSRSPGLTARLVAPDQYAAGDTADAIIFDRFAPADAPQRPALLIAPPAQPWLGTAGAEEREPHWVATGSHPVVTGVDPLTVDITRARAIESPSLAVVARSAGGTPLVSVAESSERRLVVLGFTLRDSNFAQASAFPVLVGNTLEWLSRPMLDSPRRPGPVLLPASARRVLAPDGGVIEMRSAGDRKLATLPAPGLYLVEGGGARSVVAVNVGGADVSNVSRTSLDAATVAPASALGGSGRPWWLYAVALAFVLALAEWWTWLRRITV